MGLNVNFEGQSRVVFTKGVVNPRDQMKIPIEDLEWAIENIPEIAGKVRFSLSVKKFGQRLKNARAGHRESRACFLDLCNLQPFIEQNKFRGHLRGDY